MDKKLKKALQADKKGWWEGKNCINGGLTPPFSSTFYTLFGSISFSLSCVCVYLSLSLSQPFDLDPKFVRSSVHQDGLILQLACLCSSF